MLCFQVVSAAADVHGGGDSLEGVDHGRDDIAALAADYGQAAVFVDAGADAGVDADRADVDAVGAVAGNQVDFVHGAVQQGVQVAEEVRVGAEHAAEVVAGAGGEGADRNVLLKRGAAHALVEGAVAAAGVHAELLAVRRVEPDFARGVPGAAGHVDLIGFLPGPECSLNAGADFFGGVDASGFGIYDEQMFHWRLPLFKIHVQVALDHAVVELALFIRRFSVAAFKVRIR